MCEFFNPRLFNASADGANLGIVQRRLGSKKTRYDAGWPGRWKQFYDIFSRLDTIHDCDGDADRRAPADIQRLRRASRGKSVQDRRWRRQWWRWWWWWLNDAVVTSYLSLSQLQGLGKAFSLLWWQVLLAVKLLLQFKRLVVGESNLTTFTLVQRTLEKVSPEGWFCTDWNCTQSTSIYFVTAFPSCTTVL